MIDKKTLQTLLSTITPEGYKLKKLHGDFIMEKISNNTKNVITISVNTHCGGFRLESPGYNIYFTDFENVINEMVSKLLITKQKGVHFIHQLNDFMDERISYDLMCQPFHSVEESKIVINEIDNFIKIVATTFLDEYSQIKNIVKLLSNIPIINIPNYIHGDFPQIYYLLMLRSYDLDAFSDKLVEFKKLYNDIISKHPEEQKYKDKLLLIKQLFD